MKILRRRFDLQALLGFGLLRVHLGERKTDYQRNAGGDHDFDEGHAFFIFHTSLV